MDNGEDKFNSCIFRSKETYVRQIKICCNKTEEVNGYDCEMREIYPLSPDKCKDCKVYAKSF